MSNVVEIKRDALREEMVEMVRDPKYAVIVIAEDKDGFMKVFGTEMPSRTRFIGAMEFAKHDILCND